MANQKLILAIDTGGSGTRSLVATLDGEVLGAGFGGPANAVLNGEEATRTALESSVLDALQVAGVRTDQLEVVAAGCASVGPNGERRAPFEKVLSATVPNVPRLLVTGDMVTAFWGALRTPVGVVVTAGTGSVCFGRSITGETCQVGGWGPRMGDEGSAYDIGLNALRMVAKSLDGRADPTLLGDLIYERFRADTAEDLALAVHGESADRQAIAAIAADVGVAALRNDAAALEILRMAAQELANCALAAMYRLNLINISGSVSYSGSVFEAGEPLIVPFRRAIADSSPRTAFEHPLLPPIGGAFRLGLQAVGFPIDDRIIHRLAAGLVENDL